LKEAYPYLYEQILRLVRKFVLATKNARTIMRRSGFRMGSSATSSSAGTPVLTLPPADFPSSPGPPEPPDGGEIPCESMPETVAEFDNHDFDLPCTLYGSNPVGPPFPDPFASYVVWNAYPDFTAQIQDAEFIWLPAADTNAAALAYRWALSSLTFSGVTYYPAVRLRASYTMSAWKRTNYTRSGGQWVSSQRWGVPPPLLGFRIVTLFKPPPAGTEQTTADPLTEENYPVATSNSSGSTNLANFYSDHRWPWNPSREAPAIFTGPFTTTQALYDRVATYEAAKSAIDPTVTVEEDVLSPTLTFDLTTDASAIYVPWTACISTIGMAITALAAGWTVDRDDGNNGLRAMEGGTYPFLLAANYRHFTLDDPMAEQAHTPFVNPYGPSGFG
jgi:hypothetical protein